jgi:tetratricopeptide (TPR) repeat protein
MSPGYREFMNLRFSRFAGSKCLACHNAHMDASPVAQERFQKPYLLGIGCESCHGPGELHSNVERGERVDLPSENARTIVNPVRLSPQRQIDVCQQCHLQGKAWALRGDAGWFDFRPGMLLQDLWSVYAYGQIHKEEFKVADSAFRLSLSRCYKESHGLTTCATCHDSHGMFRGSTTEFNRQSCQKCHPPESLPSQGSKYVHTAKDDCISCHMKQTGTQNTLHGVVNTDHWIRVDANATTIDWTSNRTRNELQPVQTFLPILDAKDRGAGLRKGVAFLDYYRNYDHRAAYLDSALVLLAEAVAVNRDDAHAFRSLGEIQSELKLNNDAAISLRRSVALQPDSPEAWFLLGNVYMAQGMADSAVSFYRLAVNLLPGEPSFLEALGGALADAGQSEEAIRILLEALRIDRQNPGTFARLGEIYAIRLADPEKALPFFRELVVLDPDWPNAYLNLGNVHLLLGDHQKAIEAYRREIHYRPKSTAAFFNLSKTYEAMGEEELARKAAERAARLSD